MGKRDTLTKEYLSQNDVFADAFNFYLYEGRKVIRPEDLVEQDPTEIGFVRKFEKTFENQKYRDALKLCTVRHSKDATLVLLGLEGQANIHYAMPVRHYLYDALNYASQVENARKRHRNTKDIEGNEYISGFSKEDKLIPVITLCICFDKDIWDAPRSLYDMFDHVEPEFRKYIDDYKLNLITPHEVPDFTKFTSELGLVLESIHNADNKTEFYELLKSRPEYSNMDISTVDMINEFTNSKISTKGAVGGKVNMCKAIQELIQDGRNEGIKEGIKEGINEGEDMLARLIVLLTPGSDEYNAALTNKEDRKKLYKKYGITE